MIEPQIKQNEDVIPTHVTGVLEIDTKAIAQNYNTLRSLAPQSTCGSVLKADAYGFGALEIAQTLSKEGCQHFFVAHIDEALELRKQLKTAHIYVLSGTLPGTEHLFIINALIPVLNDYNMLKSWVLEAQTLKRKLPCALHIDTGMHRNGFDLRDINQLLESIDILNAIDVKFVMSHLVSSQNKEDPINKKQKDLFDTIRMRLPKMRASLADTGGVYLGKEYHYDITRVGKGLFGLFSGTPSLLPCVKLKARILQIRTGFKGDTVGYGATHTLERESKLATIGIGFADGYDRRLSQGGYMDVQGHKAPVVGRISMDYTVIDVTDISKSHCRVGDWVELINETHTLDSLANSIGTISRELSTKLGKRLFRVYS